MGSDNPAAVQSVIQQRDLLQSGLLSTCRELSRITAVSHAARSNTPTAHPLMLDSDASSNRSKTILASFTKCIFPIPNQELERSWREYDKLEGDVTVAKNILLEQLEALGSPQVELFLSLELCCFTHSPPPLFNADLG